MKDEQTNDKMVYQTMGNVNVSATSQFLLLSSTSCEKQTNNGLMGRIQFFVNVIQKFESND